MRRFGEKICLTIVCLAIAAAAADLWADEPAAEFVKALREEGYYDVALEYLDQIKDDPIVSAKFRQTIPFERASTLIDQVATLRDRERIERQLNEAQQLLADYASNTNSLVETVRTLNFRAQLLSRRADLYLKEAAGEHLTADERAGITGSARGFLEDSLKTITEATAGAARLLDPRPDNADALKIKPGDPSSRKLVLEIRGVYQSLLVQRPYVAERLADTFPLQSPERRQLLLDAAEVLDRVWNQYSNSVAGVQACVYSGRCFQKLGQHKKALDQFAQVMAVKPSAGTRSLRKTAFALSTDSWQATDPYPTRSVIGQLEPIVKSLTSSQERDADWLRVVLELGRAKHALAVAVKSEDGPNATTRSKAIKREAARLVRDVTRVKNPHQQLARKLLTDWNVSLIDADTRAAVGKKIESFAAAFEAGKEATTEIELLAGEVLRARQSGGEPAELRSRLNQQCDATIERFDQAIKLADASTSRDDLNRCRFFQCYCYFVSGRHLQATIIGQFLLDHHAEKGGTKQASGLLLKSRAALVAAADPADAAAELVAWKNTALEISGRWPGSPESATAIAALIQMAVRAGRLQDAVELMDKLPRDSDSRNSTAGLLGQQLFAQYLRDTKDPELSVNTNQMQKKLEEAHGLLSLSESTALPGAITFSDAVTGLMLVEARLIIGDADLALQVLDSSSLSPLKIIKDQNPVVFADPRAVKFKSDAYRAIVKTYIAKMQDAQQQQFWVDKATGVINLMKQELNDGSDPQAKSQLTAIYQLIAIELKKRFDSLQDSQQKLKFSGVLAKFLISIEKSSRNGKVVLVAGATMLNVASDLANEGLAKEAKPLFRQAVLVLDHAESLGFRGEADATKLSFELQRQRALAERGSGNYESAVNQFTAILQKSSSFSVQLDAAATLQQWGLTQRLQQPLLKAVKGTGKFTAAGSKRSKNAIWGWEKIQAATRGDKQKFREQYFLATYSIAEAIYEQALILKKPAGKKSALRIIKREVAKTPDFLGSAKWKDKFSSLEKRIGN